MQAKTVMPYLAPSVFGTATIALAPFERPSREDLTSRLATRPWTRATGWIARQSGVVVRPDQADNPALGDLVEAELTDGLQTFQVRRLPGCWIVTAMIEGAGTVHLTDEIVVVMTNGRAARYRRYWSLPDDGATEVVACRLIQFEDIA